jgi:tagaturonate reductase
MLTDIALNSISKWKARILPSFRDYYRDHGKIAPRLTIGFSYLMALYARAEKTENGYEAKLPSRTIGLKDEESYLDFFAAKKPIPTFMSDVDVWGEDLTRYEGFCEAVSENVKKIENGACLL